MAMGKMTRYKPKRKYVRKAKPTNIPKTTPNQIVINPRGSTAGLFPAKTIVRGRYYANALSTGSGLATYQYQFRSSANDPDYTGTGHQPYGYDQLGALYTKARVLKQKFTIWARSRDVQGCVITITNAPSTTLPSGIGAVEQGAKFRMITTDDGCVKFIHTTYPWLALGMTKKQYIDDDNVVANIGSNPNAFALTNISFIFQSALAVTGVEFVVMIDQWVSFEAPIDPGTS